jgi:two-component system OmpR family response regulator
VLAGGAREGLRLCETARPDIVLLDVMLPDMSGLDVSRRIHDGPGIPVIMVSGRRDEPDVLRGFQSGADDYVTKPFSHRELALRIAAVLRRSEQGAVSTPGMLRAGRLVLDPSSHEVLRDDRTIRLTPTEFKILYLLALNCGRAVGADRLIHHTWGFDGGDRDTLRVHISHLRRKLGLGTNDGLRTVPGGGYLLSEA